MNIINRIIILASILLISPVIGAAQQSTNFTLPFKNSGGHIVIPVIINGQSIVFQLDTGGHTLISRSLMDKLGTTVTDSMEIMDSNNNRGYLLRTAEIEFGFPGTEYIHKASPVLMPQGATDVDKYGLGGIMGTDLLQPFVVVIDSRKEIITLNSSPDALPPDAVNGNEFITPNKDNMPMFRIHLSEKLNIPIMFDSGNYATFFLAQGVYDWLNGYEYEFVSVKHGYGIGMTGILGGNPVRKLTKVVMPHITLGDHVLKNINGEVQPVELSLLGTGILNYGKVVIDYPNSTFYFIPYEDIDLSAITPKQEWDIIMSPTRDGSIVVMSAWGDLSGEIAPYDIVESIDGVEANTQYLKLQKNGSVDMGEKTEAIITVRHAEQVKTLTIRKQ